MRGTIIMANHFFKFKKFTVYQEHCAMKVCTDACLFAAYVANELTGSEQKILDIGTGTGLLSLMIAQQTDALMDALEIDEMAVTQAITNVSQSPWPQQVQVHHADFLAFTTAKKYDLIMSNPPFFEDDLKTASPKKNLARHDDSLPFSTLIRHAKSMLAQDGRLALLLPHHRTASVMALLKENDLHCCNMLQVRQTPAHPFFRTILIAGVHENNYSENECTIRADDGQYSPAFIALLQPYYLYL